MAGNKVLESFMAVVAEEPDNIYARFSLANLLAADGKHQQALHHLDEVNARMPGYEGGGPWIVRGNCLAALGRYSEAVAAFDQALRIPYSGRCSHAVAMTNKAAALDKLGRSLEAMAARGQARELAEREKRDWQAEQAASRADVAEATRLASDTRVTPVRPHPQRR
jgi:tetratricopeptide (TPR) repeat protein